MSEGRGKTSPWCSSPQDPGGYPGGLRAPVVSVHDADLCGPCLQIEEAGWSYVGGWTGQGGSKLGTKRSVAPQEHPLLAPP